MSHLKYFYHISATVVNRTVDARPCNVFVVLRRVRNSRTIIIIIRPTAKNRDQLRNPTLGNQVWATFSTLIVRCNAHERHFLPIFCSMALLILIAFAQVDSSGQFLSGFYVKRFI